RQGVRKYPGGRHIAAHHAKHMAEPRCQSWTDRLQLGRRKVHVPDVLRQQRGPQKKEITADHQHSRDCQKDGGGGPTSILALHWLPSQPRRYLLEDCCPSRRPILGNTSEAYLS